eukprot:939366-Pyramimonas_sp.AAC.1
MSWVRGDGETRCHSTARVFREWRLPRTATALRMRRLKWYQQWARQPHECSNVVAAIFGSSVMERLAGISRLERGDRVGQQSTPMAKQYLADLEALAAVDEGMREWWRE